MIADAEIINISTPQQTSPLLLTPSPQLYDYLRHTPSPFRTFQFRDSTASLLCLKKGKIEVKLTFGTASRHPLWPSGIFVPLGCMDGGVPLMCTGRRSGDQVGGFSCASSPPSGAQTAASEECTCAGVAPHFTCEIILCICIARSPMFCERLLGE